MKQKLKLVFKIYSILSVSSAVIFFIYMTYFKYQRVDFSKIYYNELSSAGCVLTKPTSSVFYSISCNTEANNIRRDLQIKTLEEYNRVITSLMQNKKIHPKDIQTAQFLVTSAAMTQGRILTSPRRPANSKL